MSCNSEQKLEIQGHRGCRGLMPENSLPGFEKAIELGAHTLELDIAITKDNLVVVSHEPYMSRVICKTPDDKEIPKAEDKFYNLYEMTHEEIKAFDCGSKYHPSYPNQKKMTVYKPLLSEVFDMVKSLNADVNFNIEIKSKPEYYGIFTPKPEAYVKLVIDEIKAHNMTSRCSLQSFDIHILEEIYKQEKHIPIVLLVDDVEEIENKLHKLSFKPSIISPYYKLLNNETTQFYQSKGYKVIPWTVNELEDMKRLIEWRVDGIITDYPDRLIALVE